METRRHGAGESHLLERLAAVAFRQGHVSRLGGLHVEAGQRPGLAGRGPRQAGRPGILGLVLGESRNAVGGRKTVGSKVERAVAVGKAKVTCRTRTRRDAGRPARESVARRYATDPDYRESTADSTTRGYFQRPHVKEWHRALRVETARDHRTARAPGTEGVFSGRALSGSNTDIPVDRLTLLESAASTFSRKGVSVKNRDRGTRLCASWGKRLPPRPFTRQPSKGTADANGQVRVQLLPSAVVGGAVQGHRGRLFAADRNAGP